MKTFRRSETSISVSLCGDGEEWIEASLSFPANTSSWTTTPGVSAMSSSSVSKADYITGALGSLLNDLAGEIMPTV